MPYRSVWPDFSLCLRNPMRWNSSLQHFFDTSDVCRVFFYFQCVVQFAARFLGIAGGGLIAQTAHHFFFGQAESIRFLGGLVQREIRNSSQSPSSKLPQLPLFVGPPLLKKRMTSVFGFVCLIVFVRMYHMYLFLKAKFTDSFAISLGNFAGHRYYTGLLDMSMAPFGALLRWWSDPLSRQFVEWEAKGGFPTMLGLLGSAGAISWFLFISF